MKKEKKSPVNRFNILFVDIQIVLTLLVVVFLILSFFNKKYLIGTEICLGLDLFIMAYNYYLIYSRRNMTIIYIVIGVLALISAALGVI